MRHLTLIAVALLAGCASDPETSDPGPDAGEAPPDFVFKTPRIDSVTPGEIALGEKFRVFGGDFLSANHGVMKLHFDGNYTDETGTTRKYVGDIPLEVTGPGTAEAELDRLYFSQTGDRIGTLVGTATVISVLTAFDDPSGEGQERTSDPIDARVRVLPSIDIDGLRTVDTPGCPEVTRSTVGNNNLLLSVRTLGMPAATAANPMTFKVSFRTPEMNVKYVANGVYSTWPFPTDNNVAVAAPAGMNTISMRVTSGTGISFDPRSQQSVVTVSPPVTIGQTTTDRVILQTFATGPVSDTQPSNNVLFIVEAVTANGTTLRRAINFPVWKDFEIKPYDGNVKVIERRPAEQVSGCVSGGTNGRHLGYEEGSSRSEQRTLSARWDVNVANSLGVNVSICPFCLFGGGANAQSTYSQSFGMDVSSTVSSESHTSLNLSAEILPTFFGVCYRQVEQLERKVDVVFHNACGGSGVVGQAVVTDWKFGFDIATGPECPPPTNLPPAEVFE